jgi:DNA-binding response OmpR family regulator
LPKVLIIDDDPNSTDLIKTLLELDGFDVKVCLRGGEAIETAMSYVPDAFLIDFHLDDRDGVDIVQELRNSHVFASTPIIMASGRDVNREAKAAGANSFLIKPYDPSDLSKHIFALMNNGNG